MPKVFFIADTHFSDEITFKTAGDYKYFSSVEAKDEEILHNWNEVVSPEDTVFILGDFGNMDYWHKLNGEKFLIKGNHDKLGYCNSAFPIIYKNFFTLSHEPMWVDENSPYANIFGHVHDNPMYNTVTSRSYCACACRNNWMPVDFEDIKRIMSLVSK